MKHLFTLLLFSYAIVSSSQVSISGSVVDSKTKTLEFVNVLLNQATDSSFVKGAITELTGEFKFESVGPGTYYLEISQVGYESKFQSLTVEEQSINLGAIQMSDGIELAEVVVKAQRPLIELQADKVIMNVASSSVAVGNSALEVLEKSPGVNVDQNDIISLKGKQGVLILIDGKNQYLSNEQISKLLESMPAESIEQIEIMHNPSAKYDAAGNAGIINIKLKKKENLGYNGSITAGAGKGRFPKADLGINLNYRSESFNIYGNYNYRYWKSFSENELIRSIPTGEGLSIFDQMSLQGQESNNHNYKIGMDYYLSDKTTFGILGRGSFGTFGGDNINETFLSGVNIQGFDNATTTTIINEQWNQIAINANLSHQFTETSKVNIDLDYSDFSNPTLAGYDNQFFENNGGVAMAPLVLSNDNDVQVNITAIKADYETIIDEVKIESGLKYSDVVTDNATVFMQQVNEEWELDHTLSNEFQYDENILAGYINSSRQLGTLTVKGGLRLERTQSTGFSRTLDQTVERAYTNVFPSLSVSHTIAEQHTLSYAYSRRIDRPSYRKLNPFFYFLDQFTFERGNPFLNPQYSDSYGINYSLGNKLFVSANYSRTTDAMTQIIDQNNETQQTFQTEVNLDNFNNYSLNISKPIIINESWTNRMTFTGFYNDFESQLDRGSLNTDQLSYQVNMSNDFTINNGFSAELSGFYQSPLVYGMFEVSSRFSTDLGVTKKVLDGQGSLKLSIKDLFNTNNNKVSVNQDDINLDVQNRWESRRVHLSFSYNFGNQKVQQARHRRTATSDEENRVSRGN